MRKLLVLGLAVVAAVAVLSAQGLTPFFEAVTVDQMLTVIGDAVLPDNSIQEPELDIGNAPVDDYYLQWDDALGKPAWREIGFDTADWSGIPGQINGLCPATPGGPIGTGNYKFIGTGLLISSDSVGVFVTQANPVVNYDISFRGDGVSFSYSIFLNESGGAQTTLSAGVVPANPGGGIIVFHRVTGVSVPLDSGPVTIAPKLVDRRYCPQISSIRLTT